MLGSGDSCQKMDKGRVVGRKGEGPGGGILGGEGGPPRKAREKGRGLEVQEGAGIRGSGAGNSVSPISSSHHLSSMNGFWHQRQEKQRPPPPLPPPQLPHLPPISKSSLLPLALNPMGPHPDLGVGNRGWKGLGTSRGRGGGGREEMGAGKGRVMR